mmetsp:Transcript_40533/g.115926  ORF Transcript_40533/g.115926 Transcript_40533/m.115926 type:complete len:158 (+) Transcript_40533:94-567(+)
MQMSCALLAAFVITVAGSAPDLVSDSFDVGLSIDHRLADASVLGLQRSVKLTRGGAVALAEELPPQSAPRLRNEAPHKKAKKNVDDLSLADVSVLGLQRSAKVVKKGARVTGRSGASPAPAAALPGAREATLLGLQRSRALQRGQAVSLTEDASTAA